MADSTVIDAATVAKANLRGEEDVLLRGRLEGDVDLEARLVVDAGGVLIGNARALEVVIRGCLVGNVEARAKIVIAEGGRVVGDVSAPRLSIEPGAQVRGAVDTGPRPSHAPRVERGGRTELPRPHLERVAAEPSERPAKDRPRPSRKRLIVRPRRSDPAPEPT